jgi:hypothetical protein
MGFWFIMYHEKIVEALNHQSHNHYYYYGLLWFTNNQSIKSNQIKIKIKSVNQSQNHYV